MSGRFASLIRRMASLLPPPPPRADMPTSVRNQDTDEVAGVLAAWLAAWKSFDTEFLAESARPGLFSDPHMLIQLKQSESLAWNDFRAALLQHGRPGQGRTS